MPINHRPEDDVVAPATGSTGSLASPASTSAGLNPVFSHYERVGAPGLHPSSPDSEGDVPYPGRFEQPTRGQTPVSGDRGLSGGSVAEASLQRSERLAASAVTVGATDWWDRWTGRLEALRAGSRTRRQQRRDDEAAERKRRDLERHRRWLQRHERRTKKEELRRARREPVNILGGDGGPSYMNVFGSRYATSNIIGATLIPAVASGLAAYLIGVQDHHTNVSIVLGAGSGVSLVISGGILTLTLVNRRRAAGSPLSGTDGNEASESTNEDEAYAVMKDHEPDERR